MITQQQLDFLRLWAVVDPQTDPKAAVRALLADHDAAVQAERQWVARQPGGNVEATCYVPGVGQIQPTTAPTRCWNL